MSTIPLSTKQSPQVMPCRLIVNQPALLEVAPRLLVDVRRMAVGRIRRRTVGTTREFLLDRWELQAGTPSGQQRPPLMDWSVLATVHDAARDLPAMIQLIQPKRSQLVVAMQLDPARHARVNAAIWHDGVWTYPDQIRLIGSGMVSVTADRSAPLREVGEAGTESDDGGAADGGTGDGEAHGDSALRASRTRGALRSMYRRLRAMQVVVVGAGGGGQELARQLVAVGVRQLIVIDGDLLGLENLDRMPLTTPAHAGQPKAVQLARSLHRNQPEALIRALPRAVHHPEAIKILQGTRADVLFSFVDSDVGRLAVSLVAREMEAVHIDTGTLIDYEDQRRVMSADVRLFEPGRGCVACVPAMEDLDSVLYHLASPPDCLQRGPERRWNATRAGSLLHLNSTAAALAVETWLGWLEGTISASRWTRLRWGTLVPTVESAAVGAGTGCKFCGP